MIRRYPDGFHHGSLISTESHLDLEAIDCFGGSQ
jgi:hypothetical protein